MPVFFKISGDSVYVARTLISQKLDDHNFYEKAKKISVESFLSKFPQEIAEKLAKRIQRVKEIKDMKLFYLEVRRSLGSSFQKGFTYTYVVDHKEFYYDDFMMGDERHELDKFEDYVVNKYGEKVYNDFIHNLDDNTFSPAIQYAYYSGDTRISQEQYHALIEELNSLTKVVCLQNEKVSKVNNSRK